MWIMLNDAFFSIVSKDCGPDELLVRARRKGDIKKVFGKNINEIEVKRADYLYRAVISRKFVEQAIVRQTRCIAYGNFKDSVKDEKLHRAYMRVWTHMAEIQPTPPYGHKPSLLSSDVIGIADGRAQAAMTCPDCKSRMTYYEVDPDEWEWCCTMCGCAITNQGREDEFNF